MSIRQVANFESQGLFKPDAPLGRTCMVQAADAFVPTDAPLELYEWVQSQQLHQDEQHINPVEVYETIVQKVWGELEPVYTDIEGREACLAGPVEWQWAPSDRHEYDEVMRKAHDAGLIAMLYVKKEHVEGFMPMQHPVVDNLWIDKQGQYQKSQELSPSRAYKPDELWHFLYEDPDNTRRAQFYPAPPLA